MSPKKEILFLDACWLNDVYGRNHRCANRLKKVMTAVMQIYDVVITDRIYEELSNNHHLYKVNADLKAWVDNNDIKIVASSTPPQKDAGELSIIELIENNPEFTDAKIASHDARFFNKNNHHKTGHAYIDRIVKLNDILPMLVQRQILPIDVYFDVAKRGTPNLKGGWNRLKIERKKSYRGRKTSPRFK